MRLLKIHIILKKTFTADSHFQYLHLVMAIKINYYYSKSRIGGNECLSYRDLVSFF